jgi:GT2 family glycosyltransferase
MILKEMQIVAKTDGTMSEENGSRPDCANAKISIVVATFNRRDSLMRLLESFSKQTCPSFEIIVVSDGSTDGTVHMLHELKGHIGKLRVIDAENRGPGAARNAGARVASADYLAFTDDDCVASEDWLDQFLLAFEQTGAVAVQGRTTTERLSRSPLTHQMEILTPQLKTLPTCNVAYLKSAFKAVGGFDESFKFAHNEDADLAWRIEEVGKIVFVPEAKIMHPPRPDSFWKRACWVQALEGDFLLYHKNRDKYRKYRSFSPWWNIYWNIFIVGQIRMIKANCKYLLKPFRPHYFFVGMALVAARWLNLIRFFPIYYKASNSYRKKYSGK